MITNRKRCSSREREQTKRYSPPDDRPTKKRRKKNQTPNNQQRVATVESFVLDQASDASDPSSSEEEEESEREHTLSDSETESQAIKERTIRHVGNRILQSQPKAALELEAIEKNESIEGKKWIDNSNDDDDCNRNEQQKKRRCIKEDESDDDEEDAHLSPQSLKELLKDCDVDEIEDQHPGLGDAIEEKRSSLVNSRAAIKHRKQHAARNEMKEQRFRRGYNNTLAINNVTSTKSNCNNVSNSDHSVTNNNSGNTTINITLNGDKTIGVDEIGSIINQSRNPQDNQRASASTASALATNSAAALASTPPLASTSTSVFANAHFNQQALNATLMHSQLYNNQMMIQYPNHNQQMSNQQMSNQLIPYQNQMHTLPAAMQMTGNAFPYHAPSTSWPVNVDQLIQCYVGTNGRDDWISWYNEIYKHYKQHGTTRNVLFSGWVGNQKNATTLTPLKRNLLSAIGIL